MKISELFGKGRAVLSFEVFPPKKNTGGDLSRVYSVLEELSGLKPDYISVTYGAGGSVADTSTRDIASFIKEKCGVEAVAHITCVNNSKDEVTRVLDSFKNAGIENILALRGDINPEKPPKTDFKYASDLISFIKSRPEYDFGIAAACYPEGHTEAQSLTADILNLKAKVDAGAQELITQLFFDNSFFFDFREKLKLAGINIPVSAGIMPVTNKKQIERMVTLCGASLPPKFTKMMNRYAERPEALADAGISYAIDQITDLLSGGADGIHIYTMNNPYIARRIVSAVEKLL